MAEFCYNPLKGVDDAISKAIGGGWTPFMVAGYRGLYDERNDVPLPMEDPAKAAALLKEFALQLQEEDKRKVYKSIIQGAFDRKSSRQVLPQMYQQLKRDFSAQERFDRVSMIATMFSDRVDEILSEHPDLNRRSVVNGIQHGKGIVGGEMGIFDAVYDELADYYAEAVNDGNTEDAEKYKKMLEHWPALSSYARIRLRDIEGVKLGKLVDYADDADESNYGDNDLSELFDASEAKREGWQEMNDYISAFGSIGKETRRVLGTIQQTDDKGNPEVDDLGFPRFLDPVQAHQTLMERLRGVTSESEMIRELQEGGRVEGWMNEVVDILQENPILRTQFYVDFHKNFQPYSTMIEEVKGGVRNFKTKILNRIENALAGEYSTRISLGISLSPNSLFDSRGNVNWANLKAFMDKVDEWLPVQTSDNVLSTPKFWKASPVERKAFLREAFNALGIPMDGNTFSRVVSDNRDLKKVTKALQDLVNYGVRKVLTKEQLAALSAGEYSSAELGTKKFKSEIVRAKRESQSQKEGVVEENINKILTVITKNREGLRLEHRVRKKDRNGRSTSMDSNVNPSYLGDFVAKIQSFVKVNDKAGLQAWLQSKFLDSSYFMDNGQILNKWIEDLFNGGLGEDSFAANFSFERFLGTIDNNFEDFTSKQHAIALLSAYFSDKQISPKSQYAHYPVFILGDSGVAKWVRAKRYSSQEILDGMYNVYRQERRRMELTKTANKFLRGQGFKSIDNFSSKENEYTLLPFLNKDFKDFNGEPTTKYRDLMGENPTEQSVKRAIRAYMDDALANYKQRLREFGVLEESDGKLVYLSQEATPATLDKVLAEYYWNTKFATIQQLQLMTIDPAFYKGTKDLQKRYKEIHAPGKSLSVEATWNGQGFTDSEGRAIERVVYFDDISIDAEESNPEFMAAVKARLPQVYKAYKDNTLTDGQGYRTLDSYRKVKIMSGEWTPEMEGVYNDIKGLKAKHAGEIPADVLQEIADRAVVFQPIKPYMFTLENLNMGTDVLKIPVQHKYAEAVIIPELLPVGSKLRDLGEWMQEKDIDLVGSTKIVKVGGFGSADIKGQSGQSLRDALDKGYVHQLNYADYRIQSNVPEHVNHAQLFGTQVRKLIMANVRMDSYDYGKYIPSETVNLGDPSGPRRINGRNLVAFYNSLIVANILESYRQFAGEVGSKKKLSDMLSQSILGNSRESMDNLEAFSLTEDGDFTLPLFEGALEHDSSAMLFSLFKKMVNKQKISGGAAVQVSAYGLTTEEDGGLKYVTDGKVGTKAIVEAQLEKELNDIKEKAIANGTFMKAPNGKPTNLNEKQWLQVRTKAFKDWFGDWENNNNVYTEFQNIISKYVDSYSRTGQIIDSIDKGKNICLGTQMLCVEAISDAFNNGDMSHNVKAWPITISAKSPVTDNIIDHYTVLVNVNGDYYIFDMPQSEFIVPTGNTFRENNEIHKEAKILDFKPRLISTDETSLKTAYNIDDNSVKDVIKEINDKKEYLDTKSNFRINIQSNTTDNVSKAIDENGEPKVLYHGTDKSFDTFELDVEYKRGKHLVHDPHSIFFTDTYEKAKSYKHDKVIPAFLSMKNPGYLSVLNDENKTLKWYTDKENEIIKDSNYDSAIFVRYDKEGGTRPTTQWVVKTPNQIKSATDNSGLFSKTNNNIYDNVTNNEIIKDNQKDNILYAECEIPWDLSYTDRNGNVVALNFEDYCNPDGTLKMLENGESKLETEFPGITSLIAYRIPTERDYSMINLRVKRFSPKVAGGTIKVPAQGTTIAGFDFDIDKLYFMRREFREKKGVDTAAEDLVTAMFGGTRVREFDTYDYSKTPLENSRVARNNQLIDLIQQRLMDPETFAQRYTPGGFAQSSRAARFIREILFGDTRGLGKRTTTSEKPNNISSYRGNITPSANTIFVFGSNPEGRHGAGAAKIAREQFGAIYGQGEGLQGNAYALPTKDLRSKPLYSEDGGKTPITMYRGYALTENREAYNIEETIGHTAVDYDDSLKGAIYFTSSKEEAQDYAETRTDKSPGPPTQENPQGRPVNRHYTGDYAKVSKYFIASNAKVEHYKDIKDYWKNGTNSNADVIVLDKGTLWADNTEYIVKNPDVIVYDKMLRSISSTQIIQSIRRLYETARQNPDKQFKIAYRNTNEASLNGYTGLEMIDMFIQAGSIPSNIVFSEEWVDTGKFSQASFDAFTAPTSSSTNFEELERRANDKSSDPEPNYDATDVMTLITYNQQNQVAGKLIGIFANQNTNHAFSSLMKSFMLKAPIAFAGHSYSDLLHAPQGVDVDLHVAELLSASVDAVKDPVLNFLNLNTVTADAGAILARLGYTPTEIGVLLNQPIIKEVCESVFNDNVDVDIAIGQLERNYKKIAPSYNEKEIKNDRDYSLDVLASNLITDRKARERGESSMANPDFVKGQLQVLKLFKDILRVSKDVSQFVTSSKFTASNAVGSSFGDLYAQQMKVQKYLDRFDAKGKDELSVTMQVATEITAPISDSEELLGLSDTEYMRRLLENPLGYEQAMYDANRRALRALAQFFPYETAAYKNARTRLAQLTRGQTLDAATINSMHSDMIVYMLSQQEGGLFDGKSTYVRNHDGQRQTMTRREYYTQHFAKDLFVFLENNPELKERPIFKYLQFNTEEQKGKEDKVTMNIEGVGGLASYQKEEIRDSWAELLEDFPQIADDLLLYNFYKLGFTFSPISFMHLAPTAVKEHIKVNNELSYAEFLRKVEHGGISVGTDRFLQQYILNHLDNTRLVYSPKGDALKYLKLQMIKNGVAQSQFEVDITDLKDDVAPQLTIKDKSIEKGQIAFRPILQMGTKSNPIYYMAVGTSGKFNVSDSPRITYRLVEGLGRTNASLQYTNSAEVAQNNTPEVSETPEGNTTPEEVEYIDGISASEARQQYVDWIIRQLVAQGMPVEQVEEVKGQLTGLSDSDLLATINEARAEAKQELITKFGEKVC